jgi:hypothetical protein
LEIPFLKSYTEFSHGSKWRELEPFKTPMISNSSYDLWVDNYMIFVLANWGELTAFTKLKKIIKLKVNRVFTKLDIPPWYQLHTTLFGTHFSNDILI